MAPRLLRRVPGVFLPESLQRTRAAPKHVPLGFLDVRNAFRVSGAGKIANAVWLSDNLHVSSMVVRVEGGIDKLVGPANIKSAMLFTFSGLARTISILEVPESGCVVVL